MRPSGSGSSLGWLMGVMLCVMSHHGFAMGTPPAKVEPKPTPPSENQAPKPDKTGNPLLSALLAGQLSEAQERQLGRRIVGNLLGAVPLVGDDALQGYVNRVGRWVALQSERPDLVWHFGVLDSEAINAFAAPGGYVLITRGLYRRLNSEAELAGVLAHEIAHVIRRHHVKLLQRSQIIAGLGGALVKEVGTGGDMAQHVIGHGAEVAARALDKETELEADRMALILAARAGYDAYGLPLVLQEIGHFSGQDDRVALLFKTHPHPDQRLQVLADTVGERLDGLAPGGTLPDRLYRLIE